MALADYAAKLRARLADELEAAGDLRGPEWRRAVARVPRELFIGGRFYLSLETEQGTAWRPVTPADLGELAWLEAVYRNETLVTQAGGQDQPDGQQVPGPPTSSSSLPGIVVRMLEDLDVRDDSRVLEIGTGTGYSTALMCERLGAGQITSIEVDRGVAGRAAAAVAAAGYAPRLVTGDGLDGYPAGAPYDRIIATCSVRYVPAPWLEQAATGALIVTTVGGWLHGSGLVRLTVAGDGTAEGPFLPGTVSFMRARAHVAPPASPYLPARDTAGETRIAAVGAEIFDGDWMGYWLAELAVPTSVRVQVQSEVAGEWDTLLTDTCSRSWARVTRRPDGGWSATQHGPARLWDRIEETFGAYRAAGSPPQHEFTLTIRDGRQIVSHPEIGLTWELPARRTTDLA